MIYHIAYALWMPTIFNPFFKVTLTTYANFPPKKTSQLLLERCQAPSFTNNAGVFSGGDLDQFESLFNATDLAAFRRRVLQDVRIQLMPCLGCLVHLLTVRLQRVFTVWLFFFSFGTRWFFGWCFRCRGCETLDYRKQLFFDQNTIPKRWDRTNTKRFWWLMDGWNWVEISDHHLGPRIYFHGNLRASPQCHTPPENQA